MRRFVMAGVWTLVYASVAWADQVTLSWLPVTGAVSYKVFQSDDQGFTWTAVGTPAVNSLSLDVPGDKLILFRVSAVKDGLEGATTDKGAWYHGGWRLGPQQLTAR